MSKDFNVPPVVFPGGGTGGPQNRRQPTAPFQPPRPTTANLPFMSFDMGPATSFSGPVVFNGGGGGGTGSFEDELPLLEELGINTRQIWRKTTSILNPLRVNASLHEDADLSGPFLFLMAFGLFQLLAGKLHFGIILGWVTVASLFLYVVFNMLAGKHGNLDVYRCLSLIGYCMLPMVIFSALSLFAPQGGVLVFGMAAVFVLWSTRVCTRLLVELASCGDEHRETGRRGCKTCRLLRYHSRAKHRWTGYSHVNHTKRTKPHTQDINKFYLDNCPKIFPQRRVYLHSLLI